MERWCPWAGRGPAVSVPWPCVGIRRTVRLKRLLLGAWPPPPAPRFSVPALTPASGQGPRSAGPLPHPYIDLGIRSPRVAASRAVEGALLTGPYTEVGEDVNEASFPRRHLHQKSLSALGALCSTGVSAAARPCGPDPCACPRGSRRDGQGFIQPCFAGADFFVMSAEFWSLLF